MEKILISACLLGERVRYDGRDAANTHPRLHVWQREGRLIALCPEVAGGLPVPRAPAEIMAGDAGAVLTGIHRIMNIHGHDVTDAFLRGARVALQTARAHRIRVAILKDGSPSCGSARIYDGTFSGRRIAGQGLTARLLEQNGVRVFSETQIEEVVQWLNRIEHVGSA